MSAVTAVTPRFDDEIHAPLRLQLCAALAPVRSAEFSALRETLGVSDSVLSKHLSRLQSVGYVGVDKATRGGRVHTSASLTEVGRSALRGHLAALRALADLAEAPAPADDAPDAGRVTGAEGPGTGPDRGEPARSVTAGAPTTLDR